MLLPIRGWVGGLWWQLFQQSTSEYLEIISDDYHYVFKLLISVKNGVFRQYRGSRDANSFVSFVEDKKWEKIDPVSKWKAPDSVQ